MSLLIYVCVMQKIKKKHENVEFSAYDTFL
jgi:hypothetical protein